jgi:hypothetical protein
MKRIMICEDDLLLAMDLAHEIEDAGSQVVGTFGPTSPSSICNWRTGIAVCRWPHTWLRWGVKLSS